MSAHNRIDKLIQQIAHTDTLASAASLRRVDVHVRVTGRVPETAILGLRTIVALGLRSMQGVIHVDLRGSPLTEEYKHEARAAVIAEAVSYGAPARLHLDDPAGTGIPLIIGPDSSGFAAWADGWLARVNPRDSTPERPASAAAIVFAVCAAMAKAFTVELLRTDRKAGSESWALDMLRLEPADAPVANDPVSLDLGHLILLGAGTIGCGVAYTLRHAQDRARVVIIDRGAYGSENLDTSLLIAASDCREEQQKARALARYLACERIVVDPQVREVLAGDELLGHAVDALLVAVDNVATRRILDAAQATCTINAGLGGTRLDVGHLAVSVHRLGTPTLSSLYVHGEAPDDDDNSHIPSDVDPCSRIAYRDASLAAPFLGAAAGALQVAALAAARLQIPSARYAKLDLFRWQQYFMRR